MNEKYMRCLSMQNDMVTSLLKEFDDMIDSLLADFKEFNDDEDALAFIAKRTRSFIASTDMALNNMIFTVLEMMEDEQINISQEIQECKALVGVIFEKINKWIDHILEHEEEGEEHAHGHDHHHHHIHIDLDEVQDDINNIYDYLQQLKLLFNSIIEMIISSAKYNNNDISDDDYTEDNQKFKQQIDDISNNVK